MAVVSIAVDELATQPYVDPGDVRVIQRSRPSPARQPRPVGVTGARTLLALLPLLSVPLGGTRSDAVGGHDARLATEGQSNRDIAQSLFVTTKTVEVHLSSYYRKLGISSRSDLAAFLR